MFGFDPDVLAGYAISAVTALIVIFAGLIVSSWISGTIRRISERSSLDGSLSGSGSGQA